MAENGVVKDQLTDAMIEAGAALTRKLDEFGLVIDAALWFFEPEINEWRLMIASPDVSTVGPRAVYERIQRALDELGPKAAAAPMSSIAVLNSGDDLVKRLRLVMKTGPVIARVRFSKNVIHGRFVDDALIYRVA